MRLFREDLERLETHLKGVNEPLVLVSFEENRV